MITLAELIAERRTALQAFEDNLYGHAESDISILNDAIERTPITSQADALAALDLILAETIQPGHHLVGSLVSALRKFVESRHE
jgi:hypothetical protein